MAKLKMMEIDDEIVERVPHWKTDFKDELHLIPEDLIEVIDEYVNSIINNTTSLDCWYCELKAEFNGFEGTHNGTKEFVNKLRNYFL